jgi:LCP family protein required for cell wall assembly
MKKYTIYILIGLVIACGAGLAVRNVRNATIYVVNKISGAETTEATPKPTPLDKDPEYAMPENDKNRLDILALGIRGKDDVENGGLLTDTILLFSMDTTTGKATLTSIPRDLTVRVTNDKTEKINTAYIHNGVSGTRKLYSRILGVGIDNVVVVDFQAFQSVVEALGGISITLDKPFKETQQWGYEFLLPAGVNNLNGEQALYYARSRYGTSDFDRSRRQMQVIMAIKEKAAALDLLQDPIKALEVIMAVKKHVDTDLGVFDLGTVKNLLAQQNELGKIKRYQLTTENFLYETTASGTYELLPRGNTLAPIKAFFQTILTDAPTIPTP